MAVPGSSTAGAVLLRRLSEPDDDPGVELPFWVIILIVVLVLCCIIGCCTWFTIYKFSPETKQGPAFEIAHNGTRYIPHNRGDDNRPQVVSEADPRFSFPGATARLRQNELPYNKDGSYNPLYMKPMGADDANKQAHADGNANIHEQRRFQEGTGPVDKTLEVEDVPAPEKTTWVPERIFDKNRELVQYNDPRGQQRPVVFAGNNFGAAKRGSV